MQVKRSRIVVASLVFCLGLQRNDAFLNWKTSPLHVLSSNPANTDTHVWARHAHGEDDEGTTSNFRGTPYRAFQNARPRTSRHRPKGSHDKRGHQQKLYNLSPDRRRWLEQSTERILRTNPGSLSKGKWHELVSIFKAWSKYSKNEPQSPLMMERLLKRLLDERRAGNLDAIVRIELYNLLLDSWACAAMFLTEKNNTTMQASQRAREILVQLQETYEQEQDENLRPDDHSFAIVFDCVMKTEGVIMARRVLAWMEYLHKVNKNMDAAPKRKHYVMLLNAYANSRGDNAGVLAEAFIRHMNATGVSPETLYYNIAIKAWTRAKRGRETAEHADRILEEMQAPKDLVTYSTVISAWGASGMKSHAVARAEELLKDIEETPNMEPNTVVLNTIMSTWVKSRNPAAANRTEELLKVMENSKTCRPDLISYNTHLHALAMQAKREGYAQRANDLIESLEERYKTGEIDFRPNLFSYNLAIEAWSRVQDRDAAVNAVKLLRALIDDKGTPEPDTYSFNQVLSALSRSPKPGAARLAEDLLEYMEDAYRLRVHRNAKPDVIGYTSVIIALARSGGPNSADRAERLLNSMKDRYEAGETYMKPNRVCFNALIDCWAKSGKGTYGARKAEALLQEMNTMCALGDVAIAPNVVTYNAVLNSWARSGTRCCANKAEEYLALMFDLYNSGDGEIAPNDKSFNTVINAISKSKNGAKAQKALRILRRMDKLYQGGYKEARPNEISYTAVLNSCAFPAAFDQKTRRNALATAMFTLQELQVSRYGQPNEVTYYTFLKACGNLLSDDEESLRDVIRKTFRQCCRDGQVGDMFLAHLRDAAPKDLFYELVGSAVGSPTKIKMKDLPPEWSCNVREDYPRSWRDRGATQFTGTT